MPDAARRLQREEQTSRVRSGRDRNRANDTRSRYLELLEGLDPMEATRETAGALRGDFEESFERAEAGRQRSNTWERSGPWKSR